MTAADFTLTAAISRCHQGANPTLALTLTLTLNPSQGANLKTASFFDADLTGSNMRVRARPMQRP